MTNLPSLSSRGTESSLTVDEGTDFPLPFVSFDAGLGVELALVFVMTLGFLASDAGVSAESASRSEGSAKLGASPELLKRVKTPVIASRACSVTCWARLVASVAHLPPHRRASSQHAPARFAVAHSKTA